MRVRWRDGFGVIQGQASRHTQMDGEQLRRGYAAVITSAVEVDEDELPMTPDACLIVSDDPAPKARRIGIAQYSDRAEPGSPHHPALQLGTKVADDGLNFGQLRQGTRRGSSGLDRFEVVAVGYALPRDSERHRQRVVMRHL